MVGWCPASLPFPNAAEDDDAASCDVIMAAEVAELVRSIWLLLLLRSLRSIGAV